MRQSPGCQSQCSAEQMGVDRLSHRLGFGNQCVSFPCRMELRTRLLLFLLLMFL